MLRPGTAFRRIRAISAFSDIGMANANIDEKQIRSVLELLSFPGNLTPRQLHLSSACMGAKPVRTLQTCGQGRSARPVRAIKLPGSPKSNLSERTTFYYQALVIQIRPCRRRQGGTYFVTAAQLFQNTSG